MKPLAVLLITFAFVFQSTAQNENQSSMQDWQYPYSIQKMTVSDSIEIAYADQGKGNCTLLFLHGLGSNLKAWQKNMEALKKDYRCIAVDLPGYGKSSKGDYPFDMTFFATTIRAFIDKMKLKKVILVGHSMGGQIAVHTFLNDDTAIEKLILIAPAGFETFSQQEKKWLKNITTPTVIKATPESQIIKNFHLNFNSFPDDAQFMIDDRLWMRKTIEYDHYTNMIPKCVMGMLNEPIFNRLAEIEVSTLVIFGVQDLLIPNKLLHPTLTTAKVAQSGAEAIPKSSLKMIPLAGHFVQWEQSQQVNKEIEAFLK
ncbi:MAG: alpha/beta hydrolase [Bacteroidota bacterium]